MTDYCTRLIFGGCFTLEKQLLLIQFVILSLKNKKNIVSCLKSECKLNIFVFWTKQGIYPLIQELIKRLIFMFEFVSLIFT